MNKIEKEIKREVVDVKTLFVAYDGTEFTSESECRSYEESAVGTLTYRLGFKKIDNSLAYHTIDNFFDSGCQRCAYYAFTLNSEEDRTNLIHLLKVYSECKGWGGINSEPKSDWSYTEITQSELKLGVPYIFSINSDCEYVSVYSKQTFIDNFSDAWEKALNPESKVE